MILGALHVHSTYSDGEFTLPELRDHFLAAQCRFVCLSDHASAMNLDKLAEYTRECEELSDDELLFVSGLEFDCERRLHMLGYGVTALCASTDPAVVIEHIRREGGVAVIAHPRDSEFSWIESFDVRPDGIEAWNSKYDGRMAPRARTFRLLRSMQRRSPRLWAFYGQDLHWRTQYHGLYTQIGDREVNRETVLAALRDGSFQGLKEALLLPSSGDLSAEILDRFDRANVRSQKLRSVLMLMNRLRKRLGVGIPPALKAGLRKLL